MNSKINNASIFITGANGGLGLATVKLLLKEQPSRIALACRTEEKAARAQQALSTYNTSNAKLEPYGGFDMTRAYAIKQAVYALPEGQPFDIIFLQAGGVFFTDDYQFVNNNGKNIEKTVFQNAFGGYLTLKHLQERNLIAPNARIVFAGGEGARGIKGLIDKPTINSIEELTNYLQHGTKKYNPMNAIGVSKLVSALLTTKLAEIDKSKTYLWFSPGLTSGTNGLDAMTGFQKYLLKNIAFPLFTALGFAQTPEKAAAKYVDSLAGRVGKTGDIIGAPEGKALGKLTDQKPMHNAFSNTRFINDLYNYVEETFGSMYTLEAQ